MILEQIAADTRLRLIEEKKLVSPEEMKEKALALAADETFPFEKMLKNLVFIIFVKSKKLLHPKV